jgi:hypothetical protein
MKLLLLLIVLLAGWLERDNLWAFPDIISAVPPRNIGRVAT